MRIDVQELTEQFSKLKTWLTEHKEKVGKMNGGIKTFVSETQSSFQGEAGDGMRACMTDVFTPLYAQFEVTEHTLNRAVDTISEKAESYFGTSGIVDSDYLDEWLNSVERIVRDLDHMSDDIDSKVRNINDLISVQTINRDPFQEPLYTVKRHVAEIKSHMTEFEAEANRLVSEVNMEVSKLTSMLKDVSRLNSDMRTYKSGSFKFNQLSMRRMSDKEQQFLDNLKKQYGFDEKTSQLILEAYLKSRDYLDSRNLISGSVSQLTEDDYTAYFTRLMSSVIYDDPIVVKGISSKISPWDLLGGNVCFDDDMKGMGISEKDTQFLKSMILLQHNSGNPYNSSNLKVQEALKSLRENGYESEDNESLYEQFCGKNGSFTGKIDFSHQMVVTAVCMNVVSGPNSAEANIASWLGDTNGAKIPNTSVSFGGGKSMSNSDYCADLDGYNIASDQMGNKNKNFMDITNEYYDRIDQDKQGFSAKTRASEFLYHKGWYNETEKGIFNQNFNKSYEEMCQQGLKEVEYEYKRNQYKENDEKTNEYKNFMKSLEGKSNTYIKER